MPSTGNSHMPLSTYMHSLLGTVEVFAFTHRLILLHHCHLESMIYMRVSLVKSIPCALISARSSVSTTAGEPCWTLSLPHKPPFPHPLICCLHGFASSVVWYNCNLSVIFSSWLWAPDRSHNLSFFVCFLILLARFFLGWNNIAWYIYLTHLHCSYKIPEAG